MRSTYVLVDFENVPNIEVDALAGEKGELRVFIGPNQHKLPKATVMSIQQLGPRARYVEVVKAGKNALDFHLAYHLGTLAASNPDADFVIVSGDVGFDSLVANVVRDGVRCRRFAPPNTSSSASQVVASGAVAPSAPKKAPAKVAVATGSKPKPVSAPKPPADIPKTGKARAKKIAQLLKVMPHPGTIAKLRVVIASHFSHALSDKEVDAVVQSMRDSKMIVVEGGKPRFHV